MKPLETLNSPGDMPVAPAGRTSSDGTPDSILDGAACANRPPRIIVLDDELLNCRVVHKHLASNGFPNCVMLTDPLEALTVLQQSVPDVLLLDLDMPVMNGLEVLRRLRLSGSTRHLPILVLTASSDREIRQEALDLGATDFLAKPVDSLELAARVRNAIALKSHFDCMAGH